MIRSANPEIRTEPRIIYRDGVNESTPYIVTFNGPIVGLFLESQLQLPPKVIRNSTIMVTCASRLSNSEPRELILARAESDRSLKQFSGVITFYMGSFWEVNRPSRKTDEWVQTRDALIQTMAHEGSHIKDFYDEYQRFDNALKICGGGLALSILAEIATHSKRPALGKLADLGAYLAIAGTSLQLAHSLVCSPIKTTEKRAHETESVDIDKWLNLATFEPNPLFYPSLGTRLKHFFNQMNLHGLASVVSSCSPTKAGVLLRRNLLHPRVHTHGISKIQ